MCTVVVCDISITCGTACTQLGLEFFHPPISRGNPAGTGNERCGFVIVVVWNGDMKSLKVFRLSEQPADLKSDYTNAASSQIARRPTLD
jgi:hypothetical protein